MKRLKKQMPIKPVNILEEAAKHFEKINGKQIVGHSRVKHPGQPAVNRYVLEDETEVLEDDNGNPAQEMPELPPHVLANRKGKS